jgi:hypothetical protein
LETRNDVLVDLVKVIFDEFVSCLPVFEFCVAERALQQFLAIQAYVVEFARLRGQVVAEEAVGFVAVSRQVKLTDFLQGFYLKIVAECAVLAFPTVSPLVKLAPLRLVIFARETERTPLGELLILSSPGILFLLD